MGVSRVGLWAVTLLLVALGSGCSVNEVMNQGLKEGRESGLVTNTIVNQVPMGLERAWIYEIDGEPVTYTRRSFRLPIGEHTLKVWPLDNAPRSQQMVPDLARIRRENIEIESITIDVEPGYRYYLAARTNIVRTRSTIVGTETYNFKGSKFVIPVVTKEAEPLDFVEGATGMSVFFLSMALPAFVVPAAF